MNEADLIAIGCVSITVITLMGLYKGLDGGLIATSVSLISGLLGYQYGKRKEKKEDQP